MLKEFRFRLGGVSNLNRVLWSDGKYSFRRGKIIFHWLSLLSWREPAVGGVYSIWWHGTSSPPFVGRRGKHRCAASSRPWKVCRWNFIISHFISCFDLSLKIHLTTIIQRSVFFRTVAWPGLGGWHTILHLCVCLWVHLQIVNLKGVRKGYLCGTEGNVDVGNLDHCFWVLPILEFMWKSKS